MRGALVLILDTLFSAGLIWYLLSESNIGAGDVILLYCLENFYMIAAFAVLGLPIFYFFRTRIRNRSSSPDDVPFHKFYGSVLLMTLGFLIFGTLIIVILDEICIGFFIEYFKSSGYHIPSLEILDTEELFFQDGPREAMSDYFLVSTEYLLVFFGVRYFIELVMLYIHSGSFHKFNISDFQFKGVYYIAAHAFTGPVIALFCMLVVVILTAIFGTQGWIIFGVLISFKVLTGLVMWGMITLIDSTSEENN
ncbi:MAG: hypothetical protein MK078_03415 [Crocinitomicaceae bacterium]|nr:hypothetical protein [Crocinitomicaceae bacterium]